MSTPGNGKGNGNKKGQSAAAAAAAAAKNAYFQQQLQQIETYKKQLGSRNMRAFNHRSAANINEDFAKYRQLNDEVDINSVPRGSASAAVPPPSTSASSAAADAEKAAIARAIGKINSSLTTVRAISAANAAAEDAALAAAVKAQLKSESKLGEEMISYLNKLPPMVQCTQIKLFLGKLWSSPESKIKERARTRLHTYIHGVKAPRCDTSTTERNVAEYLINIIGVSRTPKGILFRTDIFNQRTIFGLPVSSSEALDQYFLREWNAFRSSKGGSRKRRRRRNRTKKI
jgi:hypothetical protein